MMVDGRREKKFITYLSTSVRRLLDKGITLRECITGGANMAYWAHKETRKENKNTGKN